MDAPQSWKARFASAWPYATTASALLFFSCSAVAIVVAWRTGAREPLSFVLAVFDPANASIAMLLTSIASPNVYVGERFRMPHVVTLPTLYLGYVFAIKALSSDGGAGIQRIEGAGRYDLQWLEPGVLVFAWIVLVVVFLLVGTMSGLKAPGADVE